MLGRALSLPGDKGVPDSLATNTYGYWEPRIAVAYQASSTHGLPCRLRTFHRAAALFLLQPRC